MTGESDPREWLREEEQQLAKLRRKTEISYTRTSAVAIILWSIAAVIGIGVTLVLVELYRNRRTVVKYLLK